MKLLAFYASQFKFVLVRDSGKEETMVEEAIVAWIHVEEADSDRRIKAATRAVKSLKWMARKNGTRAVLLHSFAHLSQSRGAPELARELIDMVQRRLIESGYDARQTPFGHTLDITMHSPGAPATRMFESI